MKHAVFFAVIGGLLICWCAVTGGWAWIAAWPAADFLLVAAAYGGLGPRVFGKRPDGAIAQAHWILLAPHFLLTWLVWAHVRLIRRGPAWQELLPGVLIGRRLLSREMPPDVATVVDLTAEFPEPRGVRAGRTYVCLPILDASIPRLDHLIDLVDTIASSEGGVYIHCAEGHGRTGLVAAALLVKKQIARDEEEAVRLVKEKRPRVRLSGSQVALLRRFASASGKS
ncbi:MAG: phosphatase domain-containing putative toxin [Planctomycetota bacterium]|jgi:protein-tyrosine phosphatase